MTFIELYVALVKLATGVQQFHLYHGKGKAPLLKKLVTKLRHLEIDPQEYLAQMFGWYTPNRCRRLLAGLTYPTPELLGGWHSISLYFDLKAGRIKAEKIKLPEVVVVKERVIRTVDVQKGEVDPLSAIVNAKDLSSLTGLKRVEVTQTITKLKKSRKTLWANRKAILRASLGGTSGTCGS